MPTERTKLNNDIKSEVARLLSEERQRRGMSMNVLASDAGLSQSLISSFETKKWNPTLESLLRISGVLGVNLGDIVKQAIHNAERRRQ